jgi:hypothetical protein
VLGRVWQVSSEGGVGVVVRVENPALMVWAPLSRMRVRGERVSVGGLGRVIFFSFFSCKLCFLFFFGVGVELMFR